MDGGRLSTVSEQPASRLRYFVVPARAHAVVLAVRQFVKLAVVNIMRLLTVVVHLDAKLARRWVFCVAAF